MARKKVDSAIKCLRKSRCRVTTRNKKRLGREIEILKVNKNSDHMNSDNENSETGVW